MDCHRHAVANRKRLPASAARRAPGVTMPRGSADRRRSAKRARPCSARRRTARRAVTASGKRVLLAADAGDEASAADLPCASSRRNTRSSACQGGSQSASRSAACGTRRRSGAAAARRSARVPPAWCSVAATSRPLADQAPAARLLQTEQRDAPAARRELALAFHGSSSARSPPKLSALTRPAATSSPSAVSACDRSSRVPPSSSSKNEAPCACRCSAIACAPERQLRGFARWRRPAHATAASSARHSSAIGVVRTGPPSAVARRVEPRPERATGQAQAVEPVRVIVVACARQARRIPTPPPEPRSLRAAR